MSEKPNSSGWLLVGLALSAIGFLIARSQPKADPANPDLAPSRAPGTSLVLSDCGRRNGPLVDLGDVANLDVEGAWPDGLDRAEDLNGTRLRCPRCKGSSPVNAVTTKLIVFTEEPHFTCAETRCWGPKCLGKNRVISCNDDDLQAYLTAGYEIVVENPLAGGDVKTAIDRCYVSPRTLADTTPIQLEIYTLGIAQKKKSATGLRDADLAKD